MMVALRTIDAAHIVPRDDLPEGMVSLASAVHDAVAAIALSYLARTPIEKMRRA